ncbi:hypothetical protein ACJJIE_02190 [Microbulbifer sp. TRSA001]|uniref:hypothetical protein n=1 Tax=Microbulbifer sp. TRSA001 TaxID=3243381 RepID=UPI00403A76F4
MLPTFIAIFSLPGASFFHIINGTVPMLVFYLATTAIALIVTLTYGRLVEHVLQKMQRYNRASMIFGGILPGILIYSIGAVTTTPNLASLGIIIALYATPISFLCYFFTTKSIKLENNE